MPNAINISGRYHKTSFLNDVVLDDDFLKKVTNVALKAIMSELPEEAQTYEIVLHILKLTEEELDGKRIIL